VSQLRESLAHTRMTLRLVWRSSPPQTVALAVLTLVGGLVPLGVAYAGKKIVDAVVAHDRQATLHWVLIELGLVVVLALVQRGLGLVRSVLGLRLGVDINVTILEKALGLDLRYFEDSEFYDKLTRARREASSRPIALITESFGLIQSFITLVGYGALLLRFSTWAVLALCVATIPATVAEMRYSKLAFKIRNWRSPESRRLMYLEYVLANDEHAKEVKLFGLGPMLMDRYKTLSEEFYEQDRQLYVKRAAWTQVLSLVGTGTFYAAYAAMALLAAAGKLTLGNMTLYVMAFRQGQQAFQSALGGIGSMYEHNLYMSNLWEYLAMASPEAASAATPLVDRTQLAGTGTVLGTGKGKGIELEDVGFRYPGKEAWALRHVTLSIPAGESLALVGENGAGKTTLVKLLTRLYEPTEGRILLDGRDLRAWDVADLAASSTWATSRASSARSRVAARARWSRACRRGSRHRSVAGSRTGPSCRAGSGRRSRSRARSCARKPTSWCSTSPPRPSTPRPSTPSSRAFAHSRKGAPPSSSRTGFPPCEWPTRSSCWPTARSWSRARTRSWWRWGGGTPGCSPSRPRGTVDPGSPATRNTDSSPHRLQRHDCMPRGYVISRGSASHRESSRARSRPPGRHDRR
jgi:ATP-binding cassette, subfamily B, bacterial